jgi:hypothetical protein
MEGETDMDLTTKLQVAQELVAQATEKRKTNPDYHPTMAEIKAVDLVLVEQARERIEQAAQEAFVEAHKGL